MPIPKQEVKVGPLVRLLFGGTVKEANRMIEEAYKEADTIKAEADKAKEEAEAKKLYPNHYPNASDYYKERLIKRAVKNGDKFISTDAEKTIEKFAEIDDEVTK